MQGVERTQIGNFSNEIGENACSFDRFTLMTGGDRFLKYFFQAFVDFLNKLRVANTGTIKKKKKFEENCFG